MSSLLRTLAMFLFLSAGGTGPAHANPVWVPPVPGDPKVVRGFDPPVQRWDPGHRGVDLIATRDSEVRAAGPGIVTFAGVLAGRGVVTVTHGGLRSTYEPVAATVRVGDRVPGGAVLGRLQPGHGRPGPGQSVLHWGLRRGDVYLDPLSLLRRSPPRLLPFWTPATPRGGPGHDPPASGAVATGTHPAAASGRTERIGVRVGQPARPGPSSGREGSPVAAGAVVTVMALATVTAAVRRRGPP